MKTVRAYFSSLVIVLIISHLRAMAQCPSTIDANFADALRTLYPAQNFVDASNTLTSNVTSYTGTLDFKGWGNTTTSSGASSSYASKPKLTTIDGIQCFTSLTKLNVNNQNLTGALPAVALTITELRCQTNNLTSLPSLPPNLTYLDCRINQISALPDLPATLKYLICGANKLSSIPKLPDGLLYLKCNIQHTKAPSFTISSESDKLLASLPELPNGLLALNFTDNKITSLPTLPSTLVYLNAQNNLSLKCLPALTNPSFFTAALPSNAYFTDGGTLAEPRLNLTNTAVGCLPNLPAGWTTNKSQPTKLGAPGSLCSDAPSVSVTTGCSIEGGSTGLITVTATGGMAAYEYSLDGISYQASAVFLGLSPGNKTVYVRHKSGIDCPSAVATVQTSVVSCTSVTYYVSPTGTDTPGNGTQALPWKTIRYASRQVAANNGHTVQLSAGTFVEDSVIVWPSGVNLIGAGQDSSIVKVNQYYHYQNFPSTCATYYESFPSSPNQYVIQVNGNYQQFRKFQLDGQAKTCHGGFFVKNGNAILFDEVKITDFNHSGIWLGRSDNTEIKRSILKNNSSGGNTQELAQILIYNTSRLRIHDNELNSLPSPGYGIKIYSPSWTSQCNWIWWTDNVNTLSEDVKIYNNTITVNEKGTWANFLAPSITIEVNGMSIRNWEIFNNVLNNHISIVTNYSGTVTPPTTPSVRIHNNDFEVSEGYRYSIEANAPGMEIDHNFFNGGFYPIAQWDAGRGNFSNMTIHHNVFYATNATNYEGNPLWLLHFQREVDNFHFNNNTLVDTKGLKNFVDLTKKTAPFVGAELKNNVFVSTSGAVRDFFAESYFTNPTVSNNLFYRFKAFGRDSIAIDSARLATSILQLTGDKPLPYFELAAGSPAVDAGVEIPGITDGYQGTKPDLGAYESNQSVNLSVAQQDGDGGQTTNNQIKPFLQLNNAGNTGVPYQDLKARYWLTAEEFAPINTWIDYAPVGNSNVKLAYVPLVQLRQGALGYLEYNFDPAAGTLNGAGNSGVIQSRVAKADWTAFNETDDYSFGANAALTPNSRITLYRNGVLVWGTEPASVSTNQALTVQTENRNNSPSTNTISTYLKIRNVGNVPVNYKDLKVRYWFTADGTPPLNYWIDYAQVGNGNIKGSFVKPATDLNGADTYFELAVDSTVGTLYPLSSSGNVQYRLAKNDWSNFDETNDYSYKASAPMADNDHVTVYYKGQLVYGTEPVSGSRLAAESPKSELNNVILYPNPSTGGRLFIRSGGATISRVDLTTITGQIVPVEVASPTGDEVQVTPARILTPGIYLLTIHTPMGTITKRVLISETGFRAN